MRDCLPPQVIRRLFGSRAGGSHLPAWRRGARRDGRLDRRQVRKSRPGGHSGGDRDPARAGRRESHGPRVRGLLDQPEAVRPVPRPLLARRRQGRQPRRPRPRRAMPSEASSSPGSSTSGPRFRRPRRPDGSIAGPLESRPSPSHPEPPRPRKRWRAGTTRRCGACAGSRPLHGDPASTSSSCAAWPPTASS